MSHAVLAEIAFVRLEGDVMKEQKGKFILFDIADFARWLTQIHTERKIFLVQNHHTFIPSYRDFDGHNHFERLVAMERAHLQRGFSEIAQNFTTFPDGTVAVCRSLEKAPAGIKGANANGICIENVGNFDAGHDVMSEQQRNTIIRLNALLCQRFNLTPSATTIVFHHWYDLTTGERTNGTGDTKTCPGTAFFGGNSVSSAETNFIPLIRKEIADLPRESKPLATPSMTAGDLL